MTRPTRRDRNRRHLGLERLEGRELMSLGAEFAATVNTKTTNAHFDSANAGSSNGRSVAVWVDTFKTTDHDIRAQRFDAVGNKTGPEILVSGSTLDEDQPSVAMDGLGNFVVAWRQRQPSGDTNVIARRFSSTGTPIGSVVSVGIGAFREHDPSVAMDAHGNFIVAYTRDTNNKNPDVFAKKFNASNVNTAVISVDTDPNLADHASIAMTTDGRFDIAYEHAFNGAPNDIILKQFSAANTLSWTREVANSQSDEALPSVSMDDTGKAVVVWQNAVGTGSEVRFSRADASGNLGPELIVENSGFNERKPSVALKRNGSGAFVVTYEQTVRNFPFPAVTHARVAEVSATDHVTNLEAGVRSRPVVSINGLGRYLVTYTSNDSGDQNIRRRIGTL